MSLEHQVKHYINARLGLHYQVNCHITIYTKKAQFLTSVAAENSSVLHLCQQKRSFE